MRRGRVLFICHDVYQDFNVFPLGPAYLAACLNEAGHEVEAYCMDVFHYSNEQLHEHLTHNEYDLIGVSFLAARYKETIVELCQTINAGKKGAWLVLGGHGPSSISEYILLDTMADVVGIGECEETIVDLLKCKLSGGELSAVLGIAYRVGDNVHINPKREPIKHLDSIPFPLWEIFPMDKYIDATKRAGIDAQEKNIAMISSRGCINRCSFCYRMEKGIRIRSVVNVVAEIKYLYERYNVTLFDFLDEMFIINKDRLKDFKKMLDEQNLKIKFYANCRVDIFDEEMALLLKECGCILLNIGFESTSQEVLDKMNKNTCVEDNIRAAEIANSIGLNIGLNFIWGMPGDNEHTLRDNAEFIKRYNTYAQVRTERPVTPYPGCDLYYYAIKQGLLNGPEDFFEKFKNSDLLTVNFTGLSDLQVYELLFEVNKELILDHFVHTSGDMAVAGELIQGFYDLYFKGDTSFRGARRYGKNDLKHIVRQEVINKNTL